MLTEFGKALRKLRLDRSEVLKDMAIALNISSSYLSAIENGKRNVPRNFIAQLTQEYNLDKSGITKLKSALDKSVEDIALNIGTTQGTKREAALVFARSFEEIDEDTAKNIIELLNRGEPYSE